MILPIANVRKQNPIITPRYPNNGRIHMVEAILGIVEMQLMTVRRPEDSRVLIGRYYIAIPCATRVVTGAYYLVFGFSSSSPSSTLLAALETIT